MKPLLVAALLALTACGGTPAGAARHDLVVEQQVLPGGPVFMEGAFSEVRVDGEVPVEPAEPTRTLVLRDLPAGRYLVEPALRPCDGNCEHLGSRTHHCSLEVEVPATTRLRVAYRTDGACEVAPV